LRQQSRCDAKPLLETKSRFPQAAHFQGPDALLTTGPSQEASCSVATTGDSRFERPHREQQEHQAAIAAGELLDEINEASSSSFPGVTAADDDDESTVPRQCSASSARSPALRFISLADATEWLAHSTGSSLLRKSGWMREREVVRL